MRIPTLSRENEFKFIINQHTKNRNKRYYTTGPWGGKKKKKHNSEDIRNVILNFIFQWAFKADIFFHFIFTTPMPREQKL